ncbi:cupredoxin domain-containing protein [Nitrosomonas sp. Nm58]|uniref:cupredoxin domain-containing protein n=1 Tax=Nitrosomonas sp. Nm58 TaxID=200126 RepID=UPI00089568BE|nr:cupredoxin domain-containing protein [Nitrosomonas sp. Nm58]SDZ14813.1 Uncharacterized copper-binding protein, cupredoxin-like subfamily [Nitrosomonas sp. Nm58]
MKKRAMVFVFFSILMFWVVSASADLNHKQNGVNSPAIGKVGDPAKVTRTIEIKAMDNRFSPSEINVMQGETIRFIVKNEGMRRHEMVIDTLENLKEHAKMTRSNPGLIREDPNYVNLLPGEQKELVWNFTESGIVHFACGYPGHFKRMRGKINVEIK